MTTSSPNRQTDNAVRALCAGLIDYAGLFPPAELRMAPAVANYAAYRRSANAWLLGRFVLPTARIAEFAGALSMLAMGAAPVGLPSAAPDVNDDMPWRVSALVATQPERLAADLDRIARFNAAHAGAPLASLADVWLPSHANAQAPGSHASIDTIETKAQTADEIAGIAGALAAWRGAPPNLTTYVELPLCDEAPSLIAQLGVAGLRAKVRTGGVTADAFPSAEALAAFLAACVAAGLPFKATAGLHHAIRATYRLTYAPDSPSAPMYGFLNVFLAAAFLAAGVSLAEATDILTETDSAAFAFVGGGVGWRGRRLTSAALAQTRQSCAVSYGSCSFEEPVAHLEAMGLL